MPVHHLKMLGRHRANYNMQGTVLTQSVYHLNTAHTNVTYIPHWYDADPPSPDAGPGSNQLLAHETTIA